MSYRTNVSYRISFSPTWLKYTVLQDSMHQSYMIFPSAGQLVYSCRIIFILYKFSRIKHILQEYARMSGSISAS